jgi:hypothetical protein
MDTCTTVSYTRVHSNPRAVSTARIPPMSANELSPVRLPLALLASLIRLYLGTLEGIGLYSL